MNGLKYPIKYAVMPLTKRSDFGIEIYVNIVSKCYVISERKVYLEDGTYKYEYEVVFPFLIENEDILERNIPKFNIFSGSCINSTLVYQLFNNFEEASVIANQENKKILNNKIGTEPYDDSFSKRIEKIKENHQKILSKYKIIEKEIEDYNINMIIDNKSNSKKRTLSNFN